MTSFPHYFIGIPVSADIRDKLSDWQDDFRLLFPYKQWTNQHDLHITLKFLGAVDDKTIQSVIKTLQPIKNQERFTLHVGGIGTFGKTNSPRVLWAGVEKHRQLISLHHYIETSLAACGFSQEKRAYQPHITLGKKWIGASDDGELANVKEKYRQQTVKMQVTRIVLFQIFPSEIPKYKVIFSYELRGGIDGTAH